MYKILELVSFIFRKLPFSFWIPVNRGLANSEDPDEMQLKAPFHQGLHWLLRNKLFIDNPLKTKWTINMYVISIRMKGVKFPVEQFRPKNVGGSISVVSCLSTRY